MGHAPNLAPDFTLFIQVALFLISFCSLHLLVFKPFVELLKLRESKTIGLRERAAEARTRTQQLQQEYTAFMQEARKKTSAWMDGERRKIADSEREIIQEARNKAAQELLASRKVTEQELKEAQRALGPFAVEFSSAIASKLLGYKVKVSGKAADLAKSLETETVLS